MKFLFTMLFAFFILSLSATNYHGEIHQFKQPDGTTVDVKLYGSEYYIRAEGLDGYTLVRDEKTQWICYADLSSDRTKLIPRSEKYLGVTGKNNTLRSDLNISKHLDIESSAYTQKMDENAGKLFGINSFNAVQKSYHDHSRADEVLQGNLKGLCIVIDFEDEKSALDLIEFENLCNQIDYVKYGNKGSLRQYYQDISGGLLDYQNVVFGIFRAPKTFKQYDDMDYAQGAREILGLALEWIEGQGFDFSELSTDENGTIMAINMMYTGNPPNWAKGMWFHQGYYGDFQADGVRTGRYNTSPANAPLTIGTIVHENGHMIGRWPDTYKYDNTTGPDGIGTFDVMCATGPATNPVLPNPYFINRVGWGHNLDVTDMNTLLRDTANIYSSYTYNNKENLREFFIFQNRTKTGRSTGIPDEGLTVWHIDRDGNQQSTHHETYLVHANNNVNNHGGACFRFGRQNEFNAESVPPSLWYNDEPSGLRLWDFSENGTIMTYKIGEGPSLLLKYTNYSNDENGDGYINSGESFDLNISVTNENLAISENSVIRCIPVGENADMVTVTNPEITPGEIGSAETKNITFNVTLDPDLADYSVLAFRFEVEDENRTSFVEKEIITGVVIAMDSFSVNNCGAMYFDPGGVENYQNNVSYTQTFYPSEDNMKLNIKWLLFDLEAGVGCQNDYLRIYDGPDVNAPLLKKYCGNTLPPDIISSHETGALTFSFYSGLNNTFQGWQAEITCSPILSNDRPKNDLIAKLYPNPASGFVNLSFGKVNDYKIQITDLMGKEIFSSKVNNDDVKSINTSHIMPGVYNVKITSGNSFVIQKLILK